MRGVYLLYLRVLRPLTIRVGALGRLRLTPGLYVYVGSAQRGVESRVKRHAVKRKRLRWHIDYLTRSKWVEVLEASVYPLPRKYECLIAGQVNAMGKAVPGFGSTDCGCFSHLFSIKVGAEKVNDVISEIFQVNPHLIKLR